MYMYLLQMYRDILSCQRKPECNVQSPAPRRVSTRPHWMRQASRSSSRQWRLRRHVRCEQIFTSQSHVRIVWTGFPCLPLQPPLVSNHVHSLPQARLFPNPNSHPFPHLSLPTRTPLPPTRPPTSPPNGPTPTQIASRTCQNKKVKSQCTQIHNPRHVQRASTLTGVLVSETPLF